MERADTVLLAMHNSAGAGHLEAIQECMQQHNFAMRSIDLKQSTELALKAIGEHGKGHNTALHQELTLELSRPLEVDMKDIEKSEEQKEPSLRAAARSVARKMVSAKGPKLSVAHEKLKQIHTKVAGFLKQQRSNVNAVQLLSDDDDSKYGYTFMQTGCCSDGSNEPTKGQISGWKASAPETVFNDMYAYCTLNKEGRATERQKAVCGCDTPPTSCEKQSYFAAEAPLTDQQKYAYTFMQTGCCSDGSNEPTKGQISGWKASAPETVFNDMYAYCTLNKEGRATERQKAVCGCDTPPTSCVKQSDFATEEPEPPPEDSDWETCAGEGETCRCVGVVRFGNPDTGQWSSYQPEVLMYVHDTRLQMCNLPLL